MAVLSVAFSVATSPCRPLQNLLKTRSVLLVCPPGSTGAAQKNRKFERPWVGVSFDIGRRISIRLGHLQVNDANGLGSFILAIV